MHSLAQRALSHIRRRELLHAGERVGVAVSGGIDSVALLRLMLELRGELGIVLSVVHVNHKLRGAESEADEAFVADLARAHGLEFYCDSDDVAGHAAAERLSLEAAARELRYGFFRHLIREGELQGLKPSRESPPQRGPEGPLFHGDSGRSFTNRPVSTLDRVTLNKILTGHTLDDQAETVLMRLIRGAGLRGLGGIHPRIAVEDDDGDICGEIVRPLLEIRRRDLEQYLKDIGQSWREDSSNADDHFTRNRVRQLVVPLLEKEFNPSVAENLAELAEIARGEEDYWDNEVAGWMGTAVHWSEPEWARALSKETTLVQISVPAKGPTSAAKSTAEMGHPDLSGDAARSQNPHPVAQNATRMGHPSDPQYLVMNASVDRMWFLSEPAAVQRRLVKAIGDEAGISFEFKHVEEILRFAAEESKAGKELSLPLGWKLTRNAAELLFLTPDLREPAPQQDYEYELAIPGEVQVCEIQARFEVRKIEAGKILAGLDTAYNSDELLNPDSLPRSLRVRNWRPGDRFWPNHTKSPRKIKELLQERHIPQPDRKLWPVIVNGTESGEIVWMRGFPSPAKFLVRPGSDAVVILESALGRRQTV